MKCIAFDCVTPSPLDSNIGFWEWAMFHGTARRTGAKCPGIGYFKGDTLEVSLQLSHCVDNIPDVIYPSCFLLITGTVQAKLKGVGSLAFLPVINSKVFSIENQGKNDIRSDASLEDLYAHYRNEKGLASRAGVYWEVVCCRSFDICHNYATKVKKLRIPGRSGIETKLAPAMLADYQWLWDGYYIVQEDVFNIVEPYLDPRFFHSVGFTL